MSDDINELEIPADLTTLSADEINALHTQATEAFSALYADGAEQNDESLETLSTLADGITALRAEQGVRTAANAERADKAAALAALVTVDDEVVAEVEADDVVVSVDTEEDEDEVVEVALEVEEVVVAAAPPRQTRINLSGLRTRQAMPEPTGKTQTMRDIVRAAPDVPGFSNGQGLDWNDIGRAVDSRLGTFNKTSFENARRQGRHIKQSYGIAVINKPFADGLTVTSNDPAHVDEVIRNAMDETRLPGGSLVASGGWCAPSETIYDLCELESSDGLISLPEINIARGGIQFSAGPNFGDIFANTGFCYTEAEDIAGDYDGAGGGTKPCFTVECPEFTDARLNYCGVCISAGLLQQRGFPEAIARTVRGALIAHDHRVSSNIIADMVAQSTPVVMPAPQVGATAPLLGAVELQVEHFRYTNRLARGTSLEAVFPYWVQGVVRADLSRRLGVDLLSVSNARIADWFAERGVNVQFVYDWQDIATTAASGFTAWPTTVDFLLFSAGTFVKGASDIITLDNVYDSVGLGTNDYTALFTEEGYLVAKMCHDSRVVTVSICPDGGTASGVLIACDGTI